MGQLAFEIIRVDTLELCIWLHTQLQPGEDEWVDACKQIEATVKSNGSDIGRMRALIVTDGGAPSAGQRQYLFSEVLGQRKLPSAVVTCEINNPFKRAVIALITMTNSGLKAFGPEQAAEALRYLGVTDFNAVLNTLSQMQPQIAEVKTLQTIRAAVKTA